MSLKVTAIFDIGKTNKKLLLFNEALEVVYEHEEKFEEITDDDGFPCDDIAHIEQWIVKSVHDLAKNGEYSLTGVNFTTYGASLIYLDNEGKRITPLYNYLKPMPDGMLKDFYEKHGGVDEFSRRTASPAWGMLNTGMQILWLKKSKPELYSRVRYILNFPQYLSYLFTKRITSDFTYPGCHTATWDFDNMQYHKWLQKEGIILPEPLPGNTTFPVTINGKTIQIGIGIHDSSASLIPWFRDSKSPFILCSTGTWCVIMNPFNPEPLSLEQLQNGCLCYLSTEKNSVKSSLLFMGHVHDVNVKRLTEYFKVSADVYKRILLDRNLLEEQQKANNNQYVFFRSGIPKEYIDDTVDLSQFPSFDHAYHQLMLDLTRLAFNSLKLILPENDNTRTLFVSGGFNRNLIFIHLLQQWLPHINVVPSEIKNATALGAALIINQP